ncbi:TonB-dependent receptor domain-containing protein [Novosphingobium album (ex Liu et al. 2023)]|nr:TonB-dependent receptor [Novosphingobium album (ex Liu et al. 2023)]
MAQTDVADYDLPAQDLESSLRAVARLSGRQIIILSEKVAGHQAPALIGRFDAEAAVDRLLAGSGIKARRAGETILVGAQDKSGENMGASGDITVTGSRIKGAPLASPRITIGRQQMLDAGFGDVGSALRALPQNFAGGQNPGVGSGANAGGIVNQNITGGSSVNLRGLGPDATLTLLDGNRLAYGGFAQGIDISAIPLEAVDRVEIVPDGSSALYGSDAVAGVVNVILRPPANGLSARARWGKATDGGDFSQQYSLVGGSEWQTGGAMAAYGYRQNDSIQARQRGYAAALGDPYVLFPEQTVHSGILRLTQDVGNAVQLRFDGLFNSRKTGRQISAYGAVLTSATSDRLYALAPTLEARLGTSWRFSLRGAYSKGRTIGRERDYVEDTEIFNAAVCYCNVLLGAEAFIEGPVLRLPAGTARLVAGGGYRTNKFANRNVDTGSGFSGRQNDGYAYAELFVPLVAEADQVPWVRNLSVTAAGRYDRYNRFGDIATPKLGLVYGPLPGVELKLSWGRSFKAPTLLQQLQTRSASLVNAQALVGANVPEGATALYTEGGAPDLRPERATSMSWTAQWQPSQRFSLDVTYFRIKYDDRVIQPIGSYLNALNPAYGQFLVRAPTPEDVEAAIAASSTGLQNYSGLPYDPSRVAYIIDNHYTNVANQKVQGLDFAVSYQQPVGPGSILTSLNATWLETRQKNSATSPYFALSGTIWNPPKVRLRGTLGWEGEHIKAYGYLNYMGELDDLRDTPSRRLGSQVSADLFVGYTFGEEAGLLADLELSLAVDNLFNAKPPLMMAAPFVEPYDSTNFSPVGRAVALSISKKI